MTSASFAGLLEDKVILITGASSGIGADAASLFAEQGAAVVLAARSEKALAQLREQIGEAGGRATYVTGDVSIAADVNRFVETALAEYGRLDGAFNNAGISQGGGLLADVSEERFDQVVAINLKGVWLSMQAEIRAFLKAGIPGAIVNTSSVGGVKGRRGTASYVATKHAVIGLTRAAAYDYGDQGIRVNAVAPGTTETAMMLAWRQRDPSIEAALNAATPLGRGGSPREVAEAAAWLLSDRASYVSGTILNVDGGMSA